MRCALPPPLPASPTSAFPAAATPGPPRSHACYCRAACRLGDNSPASLQWWQQAQLGDVRFRTRHGYDGRVLHSFGNVPARAELLSLSPTPTTRVRSCNMVSDDVRAA